MKYLIIGCNGMAGHLITLYLKEQGHEVTGFARKKSDFVKTVIGDAESKESVKNAVSGGTYDYVVNCAGILNQHAENEKEKAVFLNAYLPHYLAKITKNSTARIIHLSTDCVFSGRRGGYREKDTRDGESFYDRSKALGELEDQKNITIRTSIVGPDRNADGIGLFNWFMKQEGTVQGYSKAVWTGMTTLELAKQIEIMSSDAYGGLYHVVPKKSITKYELLCLFNQYIRKGELAVVPQEVFVSDKSLICSSQIGDRIPLYAEMISELSDWMRIHRECYPHYRNRL